MLALQRFAPFLSRAVIFKQWSSSTIAVQAINDKNGEKISEEAPSVVQSVRPKNPIVAAAFASLKDETNAANPFLDDKLESHDKLSLDEQIINAKTVGGLLKISEYNSAISRAHALKIVSILAEWSTINKAQLSEFENDPRFIKLCRVLGRSVPKTNSQNNSRFNSNGNNKKIGGFRTDDLNTVLGVTGDDEAAKLIASISLPQMVKVMSSLAQKRRRSTPLLRSLAYNISSNATTLDLKQCADLLYSMAVLNFADSILIGRICTDLHSGLEQNKDKPAAVGSLLTSLGLLKYRDLDALEALSNWMLKHHEVCRPHDISALFLTLATLNYPTTNSLLLKEKLGNILTQPDLKRPSAWLDHVWALIVLKFATTEQIQSVLSDDYIELLRAETNPDLTPTMKMKFLNVTSAAQHLTPEYKGTLLQDRKLYDVPLAHNKSKQTLVNGMLDALKSLVSSPALIQTHVDTKMGFVIDAVCVFDKKGKPISVDSLNADGITRIAIMVQDYHDLCQGSHLCPTGVTSLAHQLLEKNGFKILTIPYNEFNTSDKLLKRVQYLEEKLKKIIDSSRN